MNKGSIIIKTNSGNTKRLGDIENPRIVYYILNGYLRAHNAHANTNGPE
ncbi:MAG: hypothetical protein GTO02_00375 [Candidatus Dadabacteria bacterium]|nr:hypothetical protein [Candidatus Dadabacteria bacterium]